MAKLKRFEDMEVWGASRKSANAVYAASGNTAFFRDYALQGQIRRASISVVSNIAEGFESQTNPSFCRYLASARGSAAEIRAQLYLALDLGYISQSVFSSLILQSESISRQLTGLISYLQKSPRKR